MLGRNLDFIFECKYIGREDECTIGCTKCAIGFKKAGDNALAHKEYDEAIKCYKKAIFMEPEYVEAWNGLAYIYDIKHEFENSLRAYDRAIEIDSTYGKALYGKAITLRNMGLNVEAIKLAASILEMYNDSEVKSFKESLERLYY